MCNCRKRPRKKTSACKAVSAFVCVIIGMSFAIPILWTGIHELRMVIQTFGTLTGKYDIPFNYTVSDDTCDPFLSPAAATTGLVVRSEPVPVENYHLYLELEFMYNQVLHSRNACAPTMGTVRGLCQGGSYIPITLAGGSHGPTTCDVYTDWNLDWYNSFPDFQENITIWICEYKGEVYAYIEDPEVYGLRKVYWSIPFFVLLFLCCCLWLWQTFQYLDRNYKWGSHEALQQEFIAEAAAAYTELRQDL